MKPEVTYVFQNDKTYAMANGRVIASHTDPDVVERQVKEAFGGIDDSTGEVGYGMRGDVGDGVPHSDFMPPTTECPQCGNPNVDPSSGVCDHCGAPLAQGDGLDPGMQSGGGPTEMPPPPPGLAGPHQASVITPNGLKGTVLGKVASLWGDEVTVRLENGRIVKLPVGTVLRSEKTASAPKVSAVENLEARLAGRAGDSRDELLARARELENVKQAAANLIREGAAHIEAQRLHSIVVTADAEMSEVADAVEAIDTSEAEAYAPPAPFSTNVMEQESFGGHDSTWLDHTMDEMIAEAESTDFTTLMDEGPEALVAEQADVALNDADYMQSVAFSHVRSKTAAVQRDIAEPYENTFLARVEACRQAELARRAAEAPTTQKEAAAEDNYSDLPDDSLFL